MTHLVRRRHIITPTRLIKEIDRLVGPRRRSEFVTDAISEKLEREKRIRATREAMKLPPVDVPEWRTPEAASQWVRHLRRESDRSRNV